MHLDEFKAWFEGFCDNIDGAPTVEQFAKIKAKVEKLNSRPVATMREFVPETHRRSWKDALPFPSTEILIT